MKVLETLKNQFNAANFRTWFAQTQGSLNAEGLLITVPSTFVKDQLSTKLRPALEAVIQEVYSTIPPLQFKVVPVSKPVEENDDDLSLNIITPTPSNTNLNPKYTMQNFVVGLSNNLAYAAAQAVIQNPGLSYNPLFIYGGTGVGKTHLMHGIGNSLYEKKRSIKIIYCSSERFMNDFVGGIQAKKMGDFRAKYRACDLLLIDDIQFISGRDAIQEEFFHTFNELQTKNSQIILTSDRPPNEIQKLESRLASRFQGGLMVDIQLPDFDTRVAILKGKCQERGENVPESCLTLIAEATPTNGRELEGKLIQIIQTIKLTHRDFNEEAIRQFLGTPQANNQKLDYKKVISGINHYFNLRMVDITGPRRKKGLVFPRQLAMYLLYEECKIPYERIGELLGGRDHTTIMHGVEKIKEAVSRDREIQRTLVEIRQELMV